MKNIYIPLIFFFKVQLLFAQSPEQQGRVGGEGNRGNIFQRWKNYMEAETERISEMDLYGVTSQLPKGYLAIKWDYTTLKANSRYNDKRELGPVMPPIEFTHGERKLISIDLGLSGRGGGHTFQVSYGITDPLDWYIEIPFQFMDIAFEPETREIDPNTHEKIDPTLASMFGVTDPKAYSGKDFLCSTLPKLGRPTPGLRFKGQMLLGDINTGLSWNFFRNSRMSAAITGRVFFPTGRIADPDNSLLYGTGPELDVGRGGWAVGATQGYDVRLYKYRHWIDIILSSEFTVTYGFPQNRKYPSGFLTPDPRVSALDPSGMLFPDLSRLGKKGGPSTFTYRPGWSLDYQGSLHFQIALLGIGIGYAVQYSQEPEIKAEKDFINMIQGLELLGASMIEGIQVGGTLSLLPLYVPAEVSFQWKKVVNGYNAIVFDNYYQVTIKTYIPIFPSKKR